MVTTLYAGLLGLIYLALTVFVILGRYKYQVGLGDGGQSDLSRRIRIHGNFAEFVPMALIILLLLDYTGHSVYLLHAFGIMLVVGRIAHAIGLHGSPNISIGRGIGVTLTVSVILIGSILLIWHYFSVAFAPAL